MTNIATEGAPRPWLPDGFETLAKSKADHSQIASRMLKSDTFTLPNNFYRCSAGHRCRLAACPMCTRRLRNRLLNAAYRLRLHERRWVRASIIPEEMLIELGQLPEHNLTNIRQRLMRKLQRVVEKHFPGALIVGGIDISLNTLDNVPVGWQLHLYFLIDVPDESKVTEVFKSAFRKELSAKRPYSFALVREGDFFKVFSYGFKNGFYRRSVYSDKGRPKRDGAPALNRGGQGLSAAQTVELASWLGNYPDDARLLLTGLRRTRTSQSGKFDLLLSSRSNIRLSAGGAVRRRVRSTLPTASTTPTDVRVLGGEQSAPHARQWARTAPRPA